MRRLGAWMRTNLTAQGHTLADDERRQLAVGLVAGFAARHPFDHAWNHAVRHLFGAPAVPPNPRRRRDTFKLATVWLALVGALLAVGATTAALAVGGMLVATCALVTATNLCLPSEMFAWLERRRTSTTKPIAT